MRLPGKAPRRRVFVATLGGAATQPGRRKRVDLGDVLQEQDTQGCQVACQPFVRLNVSGWQKAAALRYQHWYVRTSPAASAPFTDTDRSPPCGYCEPPPAFVSVPRRMTEPLAL